MASEINNHLDTSWKEEWVEKTEQTEGETQKNALTDRDVMLEGAIWFRTDPLALFGLRQMSKFSQFVLAAAGSRREKSFFFPFSLSPPLKDG